MVSLGATGRTRQAAGLRVRMLAGAGALALGVVAAACGGGAEGNSPSATANGSETPVGKGNGNSNPTATPTATEKPATPTPTATETPPTPEATPTPNSVKVEVNNPEVRKVLDRYIFKVGSPINTYGKVSLAVSEDVQSRDEGCEPGINGYLRNCPIHELGVAENIPDAPERIEKAYHTYLMFNAWNNLREDKLPSQMDLVVNENDSDEVWFGKMEKFKERLEAGEDFRFKIQAQGETFQEHSKTLEVDPTKPVIKVALPPDRKGSLIVVNDAFTIMYSVIDGQLIIGSWNVGSEGTIFHNRKTPWKSDTQPVSQAMYEIAFLGDKKTMDILGKQTVINLLNPDYERISKDTYRLAKILYTNFDRMAPLPEKDLTGIIRGK